MATKDKLELIHALLYIQIKKLKGINHNYIHEHKAEISVRDTYALSAFGDELKQRWGIENADDAATVLLFWEPIIYMLVNKLGDARKKKAVLGPRLETSSTLAYAGSEIMNSLSAFVNKQSVEL